MITLFSNPPDAPLSFKIVNDDGRDLLIQTDYDWPGIASTFGFSLENVQRPGFAISCYHPNTDGTVDCQACGVTAHQFIQAAGEWLREHDGAKAEDPGYFDND